MFLGQEPQAITSLLEDSEGHEVENGGGSKCEKNQLNV
jgi:hypothetical protein